MVNEFDDFTRRYHDHHDDEEHCEGDPDEQDELCTGDPDEQEKLCIGDPPETDECCEGDSNDHGECSNDHKKDCSDPDFDCLPCKSVEGVLNSMFNLGDHLEVFFEDEMIGCGGTFVAAFDNILIWMDHKANVNFTDLCGPISVRKIGSKRKKKQKKNDKKQHKDDNKNDKKQKDKKQKKDKKEKSPQKKDVNKEQTVVNEEVLNFVELEKEEHETEERSQMNLSLLRVHNEHEKVEDDISTVENSHASGEASEDSFHNSSDEMEEEINLNVEDDSNGSDAEEEYTLQLETAEDHSEVTDVAPVIEEMTFENDNESDEVLKEEEDSETSDEHQAPSLVDEEVDLSGESEVVEMPEKQDEALLIVEEGSLEDDSEHSPNDSIEDNKE